LHLFADDRLGPLCAIGLAHAVPLWTRLAARSWRRVSATDFNAV